MNYIKLRIILAIAKMKKFPEITPSPKTDKWYRISPEGCICGDGSQYHGCIKTGPSKNLIIVFSGGGAAVDEYTAARPINIKSAGKDDAFYFERVGALADFSVRNGICSNSAENLFRDWNIIGINYSSGDFHIGDNDYQYTSLDGGKSILHHHGFRNYRAVMEKAVEHVPKPDRVLITGGSAGAFGAAALSDDVLDFFPECHEKVCCFDGGLLLYDWRDVASGMWKAPKNIVDEIKGRNLMVDLLKSLHEKRGDSVKYLFTCSVRDALLSKYQDFFENKVIKYRKEAGERFLTILKETCEEVIDAIPGIGLYIYDLPFEDADTELELTQHTIIQNKNVFNRIDGNISVQEWIKGAFEGKPEKIGLDLLI